MYIMCKKKKKCKNQNVILEAVINHKYRNFLNKECKRINEEGIFVYEMRVCNYIIKKNDYNK